LKETIKIRNENGFFIPLLIPSYKRTQKKDRFIGVLNVNEDFLMSLSEKAEK